MTQYIIYAVLGVIILFFAEKFLPAKWRAGLRGYKLGAQIDAIREYGEGNYDFSSIMDWRNRQWMMYRKKK